VIGFLKLCDVRAGDKGIALTGQNNNPDIIIPLGFPQKGVELLPGVDVHGVLYSGAVC